jgi:hypothetical protein
VLSLRALSPILGLEVTGVDASRLTEAEFFDIERAFLRG